MTVEIKDIVYLITYVITLISVFISFRARLASLERDIKRTSEILYADKGSLNVIDVAHCKQNRDEVFTAIRRSEKVIEMLVQEIKNLNENVLKIKVLLELEGKKFAEKSD
jgi:hypothetical protein